jgi:hypothetical protein
MLKTDFASGQEVRLPTLIWTTDLHWDRLKPRDRAEFEQWVVEQQADALLLSGDIGEAPCVVEYLCHLLDVLGIPIYFVLGNHDFYHGSFDEVRSAIRALVRGRPGLHWLSESGPLPLGPSIAVVGYEGWGDARLGDYHGSRLWPRDFMWIRELTGLSKEDRLTKLNTLGDEAAANLQKVLIEALASWSHVYCVTHVPPFREACVDTIGRVAEEKLPFYTCKAVGDVLLAVMDQNPDRQLTVLCGHTHEEADCRIRNNLRVVVKSAGYGNWYTPQVLTLP